MLFMTTETFKTNTPARTSAHRDLKASRWALGLVLGAVSLGALSGCGSEPRKQERAVQQSGERDKSLAAQERELADERAQLQREREDSDRRLAEERERLRQQAGYRTSSDSRESEYNYRNQSQSSDGGTLGSITSTVVSALPALVNLFNNSGTNQNSTVTNAAVQNALVRCGLGSASPDLIQLVLSLSSGNQFNTPVKPVNTSQSLWDQALNGATCISRELR
jgi:hypothetical protein